MRLDVEEIERLLHDRKPRLRVANPSILVANGTGVSWSEICFLSNSLNPLGLGELHVGRNREIATELGSLGQIQIPLHLSHLTKLDLQNIGIESWSFLTRPHDGIAFGLSNLDTLILNHNRIKSIHLPCCQTGSGYFPRLETLWIENNLLESFASIDNLNLFPALVTLRIRNNPLLSLNTDANTSRYEIIARIKALKHLDGSCIDDLRDDAEKYCLNRWYPQVNGESPDSLFGLRFAELVGKYGSPISSASSSSPIESLEVELIGVFYLSTKTPHTKKSSDLPSQKQRF